MKKLLLTLLLSLGLFVSANADYQDGVDAIEKSDYKTAFEIFLRLAEQGNAKAQYRLSNIYRFGSPSMQDSSWKIDMDRDKFIYWTKKSAENGFLDAQHALAYEYLNQKDKDKAIYWFNKAIEQGSTWALFKLGRLYEDGSNGFLKNPKKALYWYLKFLENPNGEDVILSNRRGVMFDVASIYENHLNKSDDALFWYKKSANLGDYWSQRVLGEKYLNGEGVIKSLKDAAYWYKKAYETDSDWAENESLQAQIKSIWDKNKLWEYDE